MSEAASRDVHSPTDDGGENNLFPWERDCDDYLRRVLTSVVGVALSKVGRWLGPLLLQSGCRVARPAAIRFC